MEIVNGDGLMVKLADGGVKKIFLSSIRPPRFVGSPVFFSDICKIIYF